MSAETWDEIYRLNQQVDRAWKKIGEIDMELTMLRHVVKEQGCPNWGDNDGISGPCGKCAYCYMFVNPVGGGGA